MCECTLLTHYQSHQTIIYRPTIKCLHHRLIDRSERHEFWPRLWLFFYPFLFPPKKKDGKEKENELAKFMPFRRTGQTNLYDLRKQCYWLNSKFFNQSVLIYVDHLIRDCISFTPNRIGRLSLPLLYIYDSIQIPNHMSLLSPSTLSDVREVRWKSLVYKGSKCTGCPQKNVSIFRKDWVLFSKTVFVF